MRVDDVCITAAYFSIPVQILVSLWHYPHLAAMPWRLLILLVLFALFVLLCGVGHMLRCMGTVHSDIYIIVNTATAIISMATALYLLPLVPNLMSMIDESIKDIERLNAASEAKTIKLLTFMAFLCHEIRNPLFAITSTVSFMEDEPLTESQESSLYSINQSANLMLRLVNDVLDISKLESGKLQLELVDFDLRQLLQGVARSNITAQSKIKTSGSKMNKHKNVDFEFSLDESVPQVVQSDSVRMLQIIYNLLTNASKFTEEGRVLFSVTTISYEDAVQKRYIASEESDEKVESDESDHSDGDFSKGLLESMEGGVRKDSFSSDHSAILKISVSDTGCGIAKDRLGSIFEPFSQSKISDYREHGGTGLGLSIVARLTDSMGGTIHVESEVGQGSTFTCYLPVQVTAHRLSNTGQDGEESASSKNLYGGMICPEFPDIKQSIDSESGEETGKLISFAGNASLHKRSSSTNSLSSSIDSSSEDENSFEITRGPKVYHFAQPVPSRSISSTISQNSSDTVESIVSSPSSSRGKRRNAPLLEKFNIPPGEGVVLIVDDNAVNRKLLGRMLKSFNVEYETAEHGQDAIDVILKRSRNVTGDPSCPHFKLILMDLSMPVLGGIEATRILREVHNVDIPIVALTANALVEHKEEALEAGATLFRTKPILRNDLHPVCRQFLLPASNIEVVPNQAEGSIL